jgi:polyphosphate kinase 2 (PPK2 family)
MGALDDLEMSKKLSKKEEAERLESAWTRLTQLRLTLGGLIGGDELGPPVCAAFEGWDASGKGGAIKRLVTPMDPVCGADP